MSSSPSGPTAPPKRTARRSVRAATTSRPKKIAREELCRGLHFSPYNTLVNILWREFEAEIPEDTARQAALRLLPLCRGVLEKYDLTDDFADTPDYELFYTELTGTVQILLEDGIQ